MCSRRLSGAEIGDTASNPLSNLWLYLCIAFFVLFFFSCMFVLFSRFGYNELNIHTYIQWYQSISYHVLVLLRKSQSYVWCPERAVNGVCNYSYFSSLFLDLGSHVIHRRCPLPGHSIENKPTIVIAADAWQSPLAWRAWARPVQSHHPDSSLPHRYRVTASSCRLCSSLRDGIETSSTLHSWSSARRAVVPSELMSPSSVLCTRSETMELFA